MIYDSWEVSLEHRLPSQNPSHPLSQPTLSLSITITRETQGVADLGFLYADHGELQKGEDKVAHEIDRSVELFGTVLDSTTTASQNREAVPRRARIKAASPNSRLECDEEEEKVPVRGPRRATKGRGQSRPRNRQVLLY